jgi:hypothetical protein
MKLRFYTADGKWVVDTEANLVFPWDPANNQPLDILAEMGRLWNMAGNPAPTPYNALLDPRMIPHHINTGRLRFDEQGRAVDPRTGKIVIDIGGRTE